MRIQLIENATPTTYRLEVETPWETVAPDYADACAVYRDVALPGFRAGHVPLTILAKKFAREIRADAAQRCSARLTRDAVREKQLRTMGGIVVTEATLIPGEPFRCVAELTKRPEITLPDYHAFSPAASASDNEARRDEISNWLLANTQFSHAPYTPQGASLTSTEVTGDTSTEDEVRLLLITQEIAAKDGVTIDERQFEMRLAEMATQATVPVETYRANLQKAGALDSLREFILAEVVLDYLAART